MSTWSIDFVGLKSDCLHLIGGRLDIPQSIRDGLTTYVQGIPDVQDPNDPNWSGGPDIKMIGHGENYGILAFEALPFDPGSGAVPPATVSDPAPISEAPPPEAAA